MINIDWTKHLQYPPNQCQCLCGEIFASHSKMTNVDGVLKLIGKEPCPSCGKNELRAAHSEWESFKA
jgi:hypothetical protein